MIDKATILRNGGATVNGKGEAVTLKSGYQVSKQDLFCVDSSRLTQQHIEAVVSNLFKRGEYAGFWVDDGKVYCDISKRYGTKKDALAAGKALQQISVWDWKKQTTIYC